MKANRKFIAQDDEAVSPVIAVILMVAITVVLAATVYVWVSGFSNGGSAAAASLSTNQVNAISAVTATHATNGLKFTITSVTPGFQAGSLKIINPDTGYVWSTLDTAAAGLGGQDFNILDDGSATALSASTAVMGAGDVINLYHPGAASLAAGNKLQFIDTNSNNVIATVTVR